MSIASPPGGRRAIALLLCLLPLSAEAQEGAMADRLRLDAGPTSREVIFTNKSRSHFALETRARDQRSYAGLYTSMHESLSDYVVRLDGAELAPESAETVQVWPWMLRRSFQAGARGEEVFLADNIPVLFVRITAADRPEEWSVTPRVDFRWIWEVPRGRYASAMHDGVVTIHREDYRTKAAVPTWLAITASTEAGWTPGERYLSPTYPRDAARNAMASTHVVEPGHLGGAWPEGASTVDVVFALGDTREAAIALARDALVRREEMLAQRRERLTELAQLPDFRLPDPRLEQAYAWASTSMDALIMDVRGRGIYAGFHWFPNYWGRDSFICLPGAALVQGRWDVAKDILESFLRFQLLDRGHPRAGRLPNIVQPDQLQYASVDGTWWYTRAAYRYLKAREAAGDPDPGFERKFRAALRFMVDGAERHAVDAHGLLTHGDGETWMDAGGEQNPYSPRGDRAVEIQALYVNGLRVAEALARRAGDDVGTAEYAALAERTAASLDRLYWNEEMGSWVDHLDVDGTQDLQLRPNVILALTALEPEFPPLLDDARAARMVDLVYRKLVLPQGVTSLDPADPAFHPRHLDLDNYYYDEAYHNGDVWLWLSGPMITALCRVGRADDALAMLDPLVSDLLDHGAVGAMREIRDGVLTDEREEFGGATFQAWSLAEFLRALHEDLAPALDW